MSHILYEATHVYVAWLNQFVYVAWRMGMPKSWLMGMGWLRLVGSLKLYVSFVEYRALLQKRPMISRGLLKKRPIILKSSFAKETHNFKEPTNRSHPISAIFWCALPRGNENTHTHSLSLSLPLTLSHTLTRTHAEHRIRRVAPFSDAPCCAGMKIFSSILTPCIIRRCVRG